MSALDRLARDTVLAYDGDRGWHLIPSSLLTARYGHLDRAVAAADAVEHVCRHERAAVERNLEQIDLARDDGVSDERIARALDVPVAALPPRCVLATGDLLGQLQRAAHQVSA